MFNETDYNAILKYNQHYATQREFKKTNELVGQEKNRKIFLVKCKSLNIIPNFIKIKHKPLNIKNEKYKDKLGRIISLFYIQCVNVCISESFANFNKVKNKINVL